MNILIKHVLLYGESVNIFIEGKMISEIGPSINREAAQIIDGTNKAVIPSFNNAHTHASMNLLRGYADDLSLYEWLETKIWPLEANLTEEDVYWGTRLACLEMIKSGTTFFNDMYWYFHGTARAVTDSGIRAAVSAVFIDMDDPGKSREQIKMNERLFIEAKEYNDRIMFALGPHAIYTVSEKSLQWVKEFADQHDLFIHIHLAETEREVQDCLKQHGKRPVEYLADLGLLGPNLVAAHVIWVTDKEINLLEKHDVKVVYCPTSNMKLSTGIFPYTRMRDAGVTIALGTDSCAANNNLDMLEEMKIAALLQKLNYHDPTTLPADDAFALATTKAAAVFGLNCGEIAEGKLADLLLVDLEHVSLVPNHNLVTNLVYASHGSCIDTTICDGKILMQGGVVQGEEEVLREARARARSLTRR